ncbi:hypothetical protein QBC34DRAFT_452128 [Podospora aff. communis PSN243]|uniref:DUF7779 domain-containing protein n=1 Tax=Podospora aff. communis PSN243 TaxID=3040156 RepID=A0AAV9G5S7_9PEZI|nr:hypothetical protein QBC34DRAFT_452128 [Podospora aff. communis PSN243]
MSTLFFERDGLFDLLDQKLLPPAEDNAAPDLRSFALCGAGGVGKSIIVSHYLLSRRNSFDATFFISAGSSFKIAEAFSDIAVQLKLVTPVQAKDRVASKVAVLGWLSRSRHKTPSKGEQQGRPTRWLLVFDNVESEELLKEYVPVQGPGSVLFTSRDPAAKHFLLQDGGIDLPPPQLDEATAVLFSITHPDQPPQDVANALQLVRCLGCLHISVRHIAGVIKSQDLTFEEALTKFERALQRYRKKSPILCTAENIMIESPFPTVWALQALPPAGLALLQVISLFDHTPLPQSLLQRDECRHFVHAYPPAAYFKNIRMMLNKALLLSRHKASKTISVHRVVQDVTRQMMSKDEFVAAFEAAVILLGLHWRQDRHAIFIRGLMDWQIADVVVPHICKLASHYAVHKPDLSLDSLQRFINLVTRSAIHLKDRSLWSPSLTLSHLALGIIKPREFEMPEQLADILMTLSSTYHCLGQTTQAFQFATAHFNQRLLIEDSKSSTERDDAFRAMAYTELALAKIMVGEYEEGINLAVQGRILLEDTPEFKEGVYWPHWADFHHAWGLIGLGRAEEARGMIQEMLNWRKGRKGHALEMKEAYSIQILATINEKAGKIQEALLNWGLALFLYAKTEGDSSFRANQVRVKLGEYYGKQGKTEAAAEMFKKALEYSPGVKYYKGERARTLFKQAEFLETIGDKVGAAGARCEAEMLFFQIRREEGQEQEERRLTLEDFDDIVMIMSR